MSLLTKILGLSCCCLSAIFAATNSTTNLKMQQLQAMKEAEITELRTVTPAIEPESSTKTNKIEPTPPYKIPAATNYTTTNYPEKPRNFTNKNLATPKNTDSNNPNYPQIRYY